MTIEEINALAEKAAVSLKQDEGFVARPYRDSVGIWTIGYGRNLQSVGISEPEAAMMLTNDITRVIQSLAQMDFWTGLDDERRTVIINMAVNMGVSGVMGFQEMIAAIRLGDWQEAASEMAQSKWASQVKDRATRLAKIMAGSSTQKIEREDV